MKTFLSSLSEVCFSPYLVSRREIENKQIKMAQLLLKVRSMKTRIFIDPKKDAGLSRTDVVATIAALSLLSLLQVGAFSAGQVTNETIHCMNNLRQLFLAWQQYSLDYHYFPPNPDCPTVGKTWVPGTAGVGQPDEFHPDLLTNSFLYPYLPHHDVSVFRCPADQRKGKYQGGTLELQGTIVFAARSYSMNVAVGTNPFKGGKVAVDGTWLDNNHTHHRGTKWRTYAKFSDIVDPAPSQLAVILGEDAYSLNDATFSFGMEREEWIDWPSTRHNIGGTLSFADGHVEYHHWLDERTIVKNGNVMRRMVPGSVDYQWLRSHISAPIHLTHTVVLSPQPSWGQKGIRIVWPAEKGTIYRVEFSKDLQHWEPVSDPIEAQGTEISITDSDFHLNTHGFYRLVKQ